MPESLAPYSLDDVEIRLARPQDRPIIVQLFRDSMVAGEVRGNDTGADMDNLEEAYLADNGASGFWVACRRPDADVIGMVGVQNTRDNVAEIRRLRVREDARRRGLGTRLMEHAINFCRQRGYLKVTLDVRIERSPAVALFQKFGFTPGRTREIDERRLIDFYLDLYRDPGH